MQNSIAVWRRMTGAHRVFAMLKDPTDKTIFFFNAIECFPIEKEDCHACECLESQPVAHDCA